MGLLDLFRGLFGAQGSGVNTLRAKLVAPSAASLTGLLSAHSLLFSPRHQVTCMQSPNVTTKIGSLWRRKSSWYLAPPSVLWRPDKSDDGVGWRLLLRLHLTDNSCQYLIGPPAVTRSCQGFWAGNVLRILSRHRGEDVEIR